MRENTRAPGCDTTTTTSQTQPPGRALSSWATRATWWLSATDTTPTRGSSSRPSGTRSTRTRTTPWWRRSSTRRRSAPLRSCGWSVLNWRRRCSDELKLWSDIVMMKCDDRSLLVDNYNLHSYTFLQHIMPSSFSIVRNKPFASCRVLVRSIIILSYQAHLLARIKDLSWTRDGGVQDWRTAPGHLT